MTTQTRIARLAGRTVIAAVALTLVAMAPLAARQEAALAPLVAHARAPVVGEVPLLPADPGSLADLVEIGRHLFPGRRDAEAPARGLGR